MVFIGTDTVVSLVLPVNHGTVKQMLVLVLPIKTGMDSAVLHAVEGKVGPQPQTDVDAQLEQTGMEMLALPARPTRIGTAIPA